MTSFIKTLFIIFSCIISTTVQSQIKKGSVVLDGSLNISGRNNSLNFEDVYSNSLRDQTSKAFIINTKIGFTTSESTTIGLGFRYENYNFTVNPNGDTYDYNSSENVYLLNPFLNKYYMITDKLYFNINYNILIGKGYYNSEFDWTDSYSTEEYSFHARTNIAPGITYFISEKFAVKANFGQLFYHYTTRQESEIKLFSKEYVDDKNIYRDYGLDLSSESLSIGVQFFL